MAPGISPGHSCARKAGETALDTMSGRRPSPQPGNRIPGLNCMKSAEETVDKHAPHTSQQSQKKGPPQGEQKLSLQNNNATARPEEPPSVGGVSKGARRRKSTVSFADWATHGVGSPRRRAWCRS